MAKLTALILLIVAIVGSASAYSYRGDRCEQEVEKVMPMRSCMMWAESKMRRGPHANKEEHLSECCSELGQVSSECRCKAVKEMMMEMPQRQVEMQRMMCSLPTKCQMSSCACPRFSYDD
ncbi:2S sulfur-rich seed storage protein 1-like [Salvia divinorum]|uniref:2S sulfur-rich seed storage protein 1-like n=1 Tax=Salvia divinorum TaxID=28513 RepID=A0ABD1HA09_SALDI